MVDPAAALIDWDSQHAHVVGPVGDALVALAQARAEATGEISDPDHLHRAGLQLEIATTSALATPGSGIDEVDQPRREAWQGLAKAAALAQEVEGDPSDDPRMRQISELLMRSSGQLQDATAAHDTLLGRD